jgi:hypothetical protein
MFFGPPGSVTQSYESEDPDLYQNVTDPQHWYKDGKPDSQNLIKAWRYVGNSTNVQFGLILKRINFSC